MYISLSNSCQLPAKIKLINHSDSKREKALGTKFFKKNTPFYEENKQQKMSKAGISRKSCLQGKARMPISRGKMSRCHGQKRKLKHVIPRRQTSLQRRMMRALKPPRSAPWRPGKARHAKQPSTPTSGRLTATRSSSPLGRHNFHFSTNKFGFEQTQTFFWPALGSKGLLTH